MYKKSSQSKVSRESIKKVLIEMEKEKDEIIEKFN